MILPVRLGLAAILALTVIACDSSSSSSGGFSSLSAACEGHDGDGINHDAIAMSGIFSGTDDPENNFACMELHQYNLFEPNPDQGFVRGDPRRPLVVEDEYQGLPYVLNTALFSDYTAKHRIVFLPKDADGNFIPATYRDADSSPDGEPGTGDLGKANDNFIFPVGTVIAKTFTYPNDNAMGGPTERVIETRLLIKHNNDGERWEGLAYVWEQDEDTGEWIARRDEFPDGSFIEAREWHYPDPNDPDLTIEGSVAEGEDPYLIPNRQSCGTCHRNADQDAGRSPIGLKARHLNRPFSSEYGEFANWHPNMKDVNQLDFWFAQGWLEDLPAGFAVDASQIASVERIKPYNIPDSGDFADLDARARGYLEVNCAHCHNQVRGSVEDLYLEFQRDLCNANFAIRQNQLTPGDIADSDLHGRINAKGNDSPEAGDPMPRIARQLIHEEGVAVIAAWIDAMPTDICD